MADGTESVACGAGNGDTLSGFGDLVEQIDQGGGGLTDDVGASGCCLRELAFRGRELLGERPFLRVDRLLIGVEAPENAVVGDVDASGSHPTFGRGDRQLCRDAAHAQHEIRVYADVMIDTLKRWCPICHDAFMEYRMGGAHLSKTGLAAVKRMIAGEKVDQKSSGLNPREWRELMAALGLG